MYHPPARTSIAATPSSISAGSVSLFLAILWPSGLIVQIVASMLGNHQIAPLIAVGTALILLLAPPIGIIAGHIGFYQAGKSASLRRVRWRAIVGLSLSYLWLLSVFFISDLGPALVYWLQHRL